MASFRNVIKLIPQFSGDYADLPRFIRAIELALSTDETLEKADSSASKQRIINHIIVNCIDTRTYNKIKDRKINSVEALKKAMSEEMLINIDPEHVLSQMHECKQNFNQSVNDFASEIKILRDIFFDSLENTSNFDLTSIKMYNEKLIIKSFVKGVIPALRILLLTKEFSSLDEAILWAEKKEKEINFGNFNDNHGIIEIDQTNWSRKNFNKQNNPKFGNEKVSPDKPHLKNYNYSRNFHKPYADDENDINDSVQVMNASFTNESFALDKIDFEDNNPLPEEQEQKTTYRRSNEGKEKLSSSFLDMDQPHPCMEDYYSENE